MATYKQYYQGFLADKNSTQHFACHSHHYWPDVTRQAMLEYWDDSARLVDAKWGMFFSEKLPMLQGFIANHLALSDPQQIAFAPNTHELLFRVLTTLDWNKSNTIVTTDSEFHSFNRQVDRLSELPQFNIVKVPVLPFTNFPERFAQTVLEHNPELVFFSHVFFNSGFAIPSLNELIAQFAHLDTIIMVDGYHGFMAVPTNLAGIEERVFYLAGAYKYAQAGEGACFMHVPKSELKRPIYTGWYAEFGELHAARSSHVKYSTDGNHYAGATMDLTAAYRLLAVFKWLQAIKVSVLDIHVHVQQLQSHFLQLLAELNHPLLNKDALMLHDEQHHGHFFTFALADDEITAKLGEYLKQYKVLTDWRGNRLRFGFALYQDSEDFDLSCLNHFSSQP